MRSIIIFLLLCSSCFGQIDMTYIKAKSLIGVTSPKVVGDRILVGEDSRPSVATVAIITVKSDAKFVRLVARKSIFEKGSLEKISDTEWLLSGSGRFIVEATSFDPDKGIDENAIEVTLDQAPPPGPDPKPEPEPDPEPTPNPTPVPNEYNVGKVSLQNAPKDQPMAMQIANMYRSSASKLWGQGALADIVSINKDLDKQFAAKKCTDQAVCQQWDKWKKAVSDAMVAEQKRRGTFTRQDWFSALNEVASGLEAVR